jgi:hypothetical protein
VEAAGSRAAGGDPAPDEQLLDVRMCDLGVTLDRPCDPAAVAQVCQELAERGIVFRPHFWVSDDFFTPDDVPGIAIPFYLTHPRLERLERNQHLRGRGGHAVLADAHPAPRGRPRARQRVPDLRQRADRQKLFGPSSAPYPDYYTPRPYSRSFVLHLDSWYAQSHPDEDFAETFAVWLHPRHDWRKRYADWPALQKLEYMDRLMREIAGQEPPVRTRRVVWPLHRIRRTLGQHYARKAKHYGLDYPNFYDSDLRRLFSDAPDHASAMPASRFLEPDPEGRAPNRVRLDGRLPVHDRPGAAGDERPLRRTQPAAREPEDARRLTSWSSDDAHDELPAQRQAHGGAVMKRRVMVLMHHYLVPPRTSRATT